MDQYNIHDYTSKLHVNYDRYIYLKIIIRKLNFMILSLHKVSSISYINNIYLWIINYLNESKNLYLVMSKLTLVRTLYLII